jgi:hypothetical protein
MKYDPFMEKIRINTGDDITSLCLRYIALIPDARFLKLKNIVVSEGNILTFLRI